MKKRTREIKTPSNKSERNSNNLMKRKMIFLGILFSFCLTFVFGKVFYIKSVHGEEYEREAIENDLSSTAQAVKISAIRGSILDRDNKSLAASEPVDDIILEVRILNEIKIKEEKQEKENAKNKGTQYKDTLTNLNKYLGIPMEELEGYFVTDADGNLNEKYDKNYVKIADDVDRIISNQLMKSDVVGVYPEQDSKRTYVFGNMAAPVIGFMRGDARLGLELYYDEELSGEDGKTYETYDEDYNLTSVKQEPQNGYSLVTTIDSTIQQFAEEAVLEAGQQYECENTSAIVMDPNTGRVLAMAQNPSFDNNDPTNIEKITSTVAQEELALLTPEEQITELEKVWTNFNIANSFQPGSIYKPAVVATALDEGVITPDSKFYCEGSVNIFGTTIHCWDTDGHGTQNVTQALKNSCNVALMQIASAMGSEMFYESQRNFGFGQKTGIDLPGEMSCAALMYSPEDLQNPVNFATSAMGQGFNATPIQAINAFSAVINGGNLMKPYVVSQVVDEDGNIVKENSPTVQNKVISENTSDWMRVALQQVVTPGGTGHNAVIDGYNIGGKTGTGQQGDYADGINTLSFIGYFPVEDPEIIVMTVIHRSPEAHLQGSTSATPMAHDLMVKIIEYMGIEPSDPSVVSEIDAVNEGTVVLEDLTGMSVVDATTYLNENSLNYEAVGAGGRIISSTVPKAGSVVEPEAKIFLYFEEEENMDGLIMVPDVTNISEADAIELLTEIGLTPVTSYAYPEGSEEANEVMDETSLEIETVTDSDENMDSSEDSQNEDNSSNEEGNEDENTETNNGGTVLEQMPKSEVYVPEGTEIKLRIG